MLAHPSFLRLDKVFWAYVRLISQTIGYTEPQTRQVRIYSLEEMLQALRQNQLNIEPLTVSDNPSPFAQQLMEYFEYRAKALNEFVAPRLMNVERARAVFYEHKEKLQPSCPLPMNKQKGDKRDFNYLAGLVNMIIEQELQTLPCDYNPKQLTFFSRRESLLRSFARHVDGCFPSCHNPVAIWEVKEYYYTTTFGSRIADGIYETWLDGFELQELRDHEGIHIQHLLITDAYETWWMMGRSYLCRLLDILHMGYVDEILFGYEVVERLPLVVQSWLSQYSP